MPNHEMPAGHCGNDDLDIDSEQSLHFRLRSYSEDIALVERVIRMERGLDGDFTREHTQALLDREFVFISREGYDIVFAPFVDESGKHPVPEWLSVGVNLHHHEPPLREQADSDIPAGDRMNIDLYIDPEQSLHFRLRPRSNDVAFVARVIRVERGLGADFTSEHAQALLDREPVAVSRKGYDIVFTPFEDESGEHPVPQWLSARVKIHEREQTAREKA